MRKLLALVIIFTTVYPATANDVMMCRHTRQSKVKSCNLNPVGIALEEVLAPAPLNVMQVVRQLQLSASARCMPNTTAISKNLDALLF